MEHFLSKHDVNIFLLSETFLNDRKGVTFAKINISLVFEILEIIEDFTRITYTLYVELINILNTKLR
jgi:hypothetical protein